MVPAPRLRAQRLSEELAAAQKIIQEYEDLFTTMHHNACEPCKKQISQIADPGGVAIVMPSISLASSTRRSTAKPVWQHIPIDKGAQTRLPLSSGGPRQPSRTNTREPGSFQGDIARSVSKTQIQSSGHKGAQTRLPPLSGGQRQLSRSSTRDSVSVQGDSVSAKQILTSAAKGAQTRLLPQRQRSLLYTQEPASFQSDIARSVSTKQIQSSADKCAQTRLPPLSGGQRRISTRDPVSFQGDSVSTKQMQTEADKGAQIRLLASSGGQRLISTRDPGSFQGDIAPRVYQIQSAIGLPPKISTPSPPDKPIPPQWLVEYNGTVKPMLNVKFERVWEHETPVACVKFSPQGYLAVELAEGRQEMLMYDVTIGDKTCALADAYRDPNDNSAPLWTNYLSFSPDGTYLAAGYSHGQTAIWHVKTKTKRVRNAFRVNSDINSSIVYVDFSPNGRSVASGSQKGGVLIWSMRDGSLTVLRDDTPFRRALVLSVKFSPDGKRIAASDSQGMIRIWNVRTTKLEQKWRGHDIAIRAMAFTLDGRGLLTGCNDRTIKYWDLNEPQGSKELLKFVGHTDIIRSIAVAPDGRWLASSSDDHTIRIWDMNDASLQCTLRGHKQKAWSVAFSPTGNYVACGSFDHKVSVWKCEFSSK